MLAGLPVSTRIGRTIHEILGDQAEELEIAIKQVWKTGTDVSNVEVAARLPNRQEVSHWIFNFVPVKDDTGAVCRVVGIIVQTDHQKKLEQYFLMLVADINWVRTQVAKLLESKPPNSADGTQTAKPGLLDVISEQVQGLSTMLRADIPTSLYVTRSEGTSATDQQAHAGAGPGANQPVPLSRRELDVIRLLAQSKSSKEIATALSLTVKTVESYRERAMYKLHVHSAVDLVLYAIRNGIVQP